LEQLLAKKLKGNIKESETLSGHLFAVYKVMDTILNCIGDKIIKNTGLNIELDELKKAAIRAALIHDLGKANTQFQELMSKNCLYKQALRHEWISGYILIKSKKLNEWFFSGCNSRTINSVIFAVIGHHLKLENGSVLNTREGSRHDSRLDIYLGHENIKKILAEIQRILKLKDMSELNDFTVDLLDNPLKDLKDWIVDVGAEWWESADENDKKIVAVIKALLISADVAGSALPKENIDLSDWVKSVTGRVCEKEDIDKIIRNVLNEKIPREFQRKIAECTNRIVFAKAGCGSGKTLAAYMWAKERASGRKLFFCYPTTGTATEGFKDYIIIGEMTANASLLHGRQELDMEYLMESEKEFDGMETAIKNEALTAWDVPMVICTVDQVVNIVQNNRKPLFTFPSIANAAFVFDEIHLYDDRLFGGFLKFLNAFKGAPILLMTATLPKNRQKAIEKILKSEKLSIVEGPKDREGLKRYIIHGIENNIDWKKISAEYTNGSKILIVANTVGNCMRLADEAVMAGINPVVYHSRFKYKDRLDMHEKVINGFKGIGPFLAVTTQVCEVSLDISADLLVSELAPVPSLIQRLGRLNRKEPEKGAKEAFFIKNSIIQPYEKADFDIAKHWFEAVKDKKVSQKELAENFERLCVDKKIDEVKAVWLEEGPYSYPAPGREGDRSALFIMSEDEKKCKKDGKSVSKEITRYSIPMNISTDIYKMLRNWKSLGFAIVLPENSIKYSRERGAEWLKK